MKTTSPGLDLDDHSRFHLRFWRGQRMAWGAFVLILVVALLGLTGAGGPLARQVVETPGARLDHPRIGRWSTADDLRLESRSGGPTRRVVISSGFSDHYQIEDIQPAPARSIAGREGQELLFDAGVGEPAGIVLHVRALRPGLARYSVQTDGERLDVRTLILP